MIRSGRFKFLIFIYLLHIAVYAATDSLFLDHKGSSFEFIKIKNNGGRRLFYFPYFPFYRANEGGNVQKNKLRLASAIYEKRSFKTLKPSKKYLIPPIIHQVWLGGDLPKKYQHYQKKIMKDNPGWFYKLWTDRDIEDFVFENKYLLSKARSYAEKANILRYEILDVFGGVYLDADIQSFKSLAPFHKCFDFYVGCEPCGPFVIGNAVLGARPGHPILKKINAYIRNNWYEGKQRDIQLYRSGTRLWTQIVLEELFKYPRSTVFPSNFFYSLTTSRALKKAVFLTHNFDVTWK